MSWRAVNDEAPYRKVSKQSEGLEGFLRGDTVKVEASQDPGAKKRGVRSHRKKVGGWFVLSKRPNNDSDGNSTRN